MTLVQQVRGRDGGVAKATKGCKGQRRVAVLAQISVWKREKDGGRDVSGESFPGSTIFSETLRVGRGRGYAGVPL